MVGGHTDSSGSRDYNYLISKYRAEFVKSYLVGIGVPESQTRVIGFGPRKPIADNDTEEGRELNRRVEVRLLIEQLATVLDYNKIESSE
jgi:outer membrane protein OmpA-like peptidoglycan-associated protein